MKKKEIKKLKSDKSYHQLWNKLGSLAMKDLSKTRKSFGILLPLVKQSDIVELLSELHDLRQEKEMDKIKNEMDKIEDNKPNLKTKKRT